jgi:hypothetical protein
MPIGGLAIVLAFVSNELGRLVGHLAHQRTKNDPVIKLCLRFLIDLLKLATAKSGSGNFLDLLLYDFVGESLLSRNSDFTHTAIMAAGRPSSMDSQAKVDHLEKLLRSKVRADLETRFTARSCWSPCSKFMPVPR